ncbi:MAG TPA: pitrilysin family protein [Burkholderiaceae bacterium]|nr:pitrilysin family protein [Burkholderiaceae bacterium]
MFARLCRRVVRAAASKWTVGLVAGLAASVVQAALPIEHWTTPSGARVYFVRADTIPMLDLSVAFDAGARFDPPDRRGLASMTNAMLARGAGGLDEATISEGFAKLGAQRGGGAGDDYASVSLRTLTAEPALSEATALLARIVSQPEFPQTVLDREKARTVQAILEAETKPETIARRNFGELTYGSHPYGQQARADTVAAIERDELVRFHHEHYDAGHAVVAMIGAITRERAEAIAEQLTAALPAGASRPAVPEVVPLAQSAERRIAHPASQSHILVGAPAIARGDPDYFPLFVGNYVLGGGGFVSRLYSEVREQRGLAYSVYSYFSPLLQPGPFTIGLQTRKEQTQQALTVVRSTLEGFVRDGPTQAEVDAAKSNLVSGFPLRIDSNRKILGYLETIGFYRLPLDYLDRWTGEIEAVTREQIADAFARRVHPDAMATVVVGNGEAPAN